MNFSNLTQLLAQVTPPELTPPSPSVTTEVTEVNPVFAIIGGVIFLAITIFYIAAIWKIFTKAGKPGWAFIIPIYGAIVALNIVGRPWWWLFLAIIPGVNIVIAIILALDWAKSYGKGTGFAVGLMLLSPIFIPILGFGSAQYQGPAAAQA